MWEHWQVRYQCESRMLQQLNLSYVVRFRTTLGKSEQESLRPTFHLQECLPTIVGGTGIAFREIVVMSEKSLLSHDPSNTTDSEFPKFRIRCPLNSFQGSQNRFISGELETEQLKCAPPQEAKGLWCSVLGRRCRKRAVGEA